MLLINTPNGWGKNPPIVIQADILIQSILSCSSADQKYSSAPVLGIRIRMFLGLPDPDLLVSGMDPDPFLFPEMC